MYTSRYKYIHLYSIYGLWHRRGYNAVLDQCAWDMALTLAQDPGDSMVRFSSENSGNSHEKWRCQWDKSERLMGNLGHFLKHRTLNGKVIETW